MTNRSQLKIIYLGSSVLDEAPIRHLVENGHSVISTDINPFAYARKSSSNSSMLIRLTQKNYTGQ